MTSNVKVVTATRLSRSDFWQKSLLGQSLLEFPAPHGLDLIVYADNRVGLSELYNRHLGPGERELTVFVHDDVYVHDVFLAQRVREALREHDVAGLAGSRGGDPNEPSWALSFDAELNYRGWQVGPQHRHVTLSGVVGHLRGSYEGGAPSLQLSHYGAVPAPVDALDGLFLAMRPDRVHAAGLAFDEEFTFHCYDVDFTRRAAARGLRLTTWPILVTHGSPGNFSSEEWKAAARLYRQHRQRQGRLPASAPATSSEAPPPP